MKSEFVMISSAGFRNSFKIQNIRYNCPDKNTWETEYRIQEMINMEIEMIDFFKWIF